MQMEPSILKFTIRCTFEYMLTANRHRKVDTSTRRRSPPAFPNSTQVHGVVAKLADANAYAVPIPATATTSEKIVPAITRSRFDLD